MFGVSTIIMQIVCQFICRIRGIVKQKLPFFAIPKEWNLVCWVFEVLNRIFSFQAY